MMTNTDALLDSVLDSMTPAVAMTLADVAEAFTRSTGYTVSFDEIRSVLERLNHLHVEGREVEIRPETGEADGIRKFCRPLVAGVGATYSIGSDRYACTVIAVSKSGHKITTRDDKATRTDTNGMSDCQTYSYERDPNGAERTFYRDSTGRYGNKTRGGRLGFGRRAYYDFSF